jgi:F-type H+-transporting ATPase subunit delta
MAIDSIVVERYAEALFGRALKEGVLEPLAREVGRVVPFLRSNERLMEFLEAPNIPRSAKRGLIEKTLTGTESSQLDEFCLLLIEKGRVDHLIPILERFLVLEEEHRGFFNAEIITATEVDENMRSQMRSTLEAHTGHQLDITFTVDPEILGGVIFRHRDDLIDTSLRSELNEIGTELREVRVH